MGPGTLHTSTLAFVSGFDQRFLKIGAWIELVSVDCIKLKSAPALGNLREGRGNKTLSVISCKIFHRDESPCQKQLACRRYFTSCCLAPSIPTQFGCRKALAVV